MVKDRHRAVPAAYLVLMKDGKVFLQRRVNTGYMDGKYGLPAGHVEKGESFTQCVVREVKEEIGVDLQEQDLKVVHLMHRFTGGEWGDLGYRIDAFFTADKWSGEPNWNHNSQAWATIVEAKRQTEIDIRELYGEAALKILDE